MCINCDPNRPFVESKEAMVEHRPENPMGQASFFSRLIFYWPWTLLKIGMERPLEDEDLPKILEADTSTYCRNYFDRIWKEERDAHPEQPSLHRAIVKDFLKSVWYVQPLMFIAYTAKVVQAVALGLLIKTFQNGSKDGYIWASLIVICGVVILFEHHHVFFFTWRRGMQYRVSCVAAIYEKSLRLSSTHQDTSASYGRIMNLASNDVERFLNASLFFSHLIWAPIQSIAILIVGCLLLGPAFAAGYGLLIVIFVPLQFYLSGKFAFYRSKIAHITDRRVTFVSQAVRGARVMKMSGYEWRFLDRIQNFRSQEIAQISRANRLKAWNEAMFFATNVVVSLTIFLTHVYTGGTLTPGVVFSVFTLINILQLEMAKHVSLGIMGASECYVSIGRIQRFLEFPEIPSKGSNTSDHDASLCEQNIALSLTDVRCYWNEVVQRKHTTAYKYEETDDDSASSLFLALDNVSVNFCLGELTSVIGAVGSGKSALLQALVRELPVFSGKILRNYETMAYAAQDPWIMDGTVKENILMGYKLDQKWYDTVVEACGLVLDFQQLRDGDQTIVGDRGVQCSGGQRARIGLARAVYRDADVLVADDPLSAVDAKVGRRLFQDAIIDLMVQRGKCVILATHQHQYIQESKCILMVEGSIGHIGSYADCVAASNGKLTAHTADDAVDGLVATNTDYKLVPEEDGKMIDKIDQKMNDDDNKESSAQGIVHFNTYMSYTNALGGVWVVFFLFVLFSATQTSVLLTFATAGRWAERPSSQQRSWDIVGVVLGLGVTVILLAIFRAILTLTLSVKASQRMHDRMAKAVLRAKIEFFDTNPLGRILNRFSADVGISDDLLPQTMFDFFVISFMVLGALITTVTTLPFTLIAIPPIMWYFLSVRKVFLTSSRELKRLESLARSPIFAMLSEALGGIATIRSNDSIEYFREKFRKVHDAHTRAFFSFIAASRWVGFRMDFLSFIFLSTVTFLATLFQTQGWFNVDPSVLGVSLSMLLQLAGIFQWCVRQSAEVVNQMVSVERVLAYGELEPEAPLNKEDDIVLREKGWPERGAIDFEDLSVRYRASLPLALKNVSFNIPAGAKVGIVGRTGSGKSSLVQTLFRLLEAENGRILIDGVDISKIGLHALRTKISVIPQVPTLFSGCSVRENLDLFGLHSEDAIREVLQDCHLSDVIGDLPKGWDTPVSENGSNFSVGQRQLLCLARAILSKCRILVLDEATASVDRRTDQLLHEALQKSFHDGTIISVAHRLDTVIENDLVLVLGHGEVLEFGTPADLLRAGGAFASMVNDTGDTMNKDLWNRALKREKSKRDDH